MRGLLRAAAIAIAVLGLAPGSASGQASASPFTSAIRYDDLNRVVGTIAPDPDGDSGPLHYAAVRKTYDDAGRLVLVEKGELATWQPDSVLPSAWSGFSATSKVVTTYDDIDRKTLELTWGWDAVNLVWLKSTATQYSYDAVGRLECTAVRMKRSQFASLPASTLACQLGSVPSGYGPDRVTKNVYDEAGQLKKVVKAFGITVANGFAQDLQQDYATYTYSDNGKPLSVKDADGNVATYTYDGYDRQVAWSFPSKTATGSAAPCAIGSIAETTDAFGNAVTGPDGARGANDDCEKYSYDRNGNRTRLVKRDGRALSYAYDALNRVTIKAVPDGGCPTGPDNPDVCTNVVSSATRDVYYAYNARGLQTEARFDSATGADAVLSEYDGFDRLTKTTTAMSGASRSVQHSYDADGNRADITWPDLLKATYAYDGLDRLNWVYEGSGTASVLLQYGYDAAQRPYFLSRVSGLNTVYYYDALLHLAALSHDFNGTAYDVTYAMTDYSPANQLVARTRDNASVYAFNGYTSVSRAYAVNALNQYTSSGGVAIASDANGNLRASDATNYVYDVENRLVSTTTGAATASLTYDALGRLYEVTRGAGTRRFLYDGDELVAEYDASGTMLARYIHGAGEDDPVVWYNGATMDNATRRFLHTDQQGSIVAISDAAGNAVATNSYDEYGIPGNDPVTHVVTNTGTFQYTGQVWLPEIGLYYYKARIYSPTLGRFMQTDPIGYADQNNLYAYVNNDPMNLTDPSGKTRKEWCINLIIGILCIITGEERNEPPPNPPKPRPPIERPMPKPQPRPGPPPSPMLPPTPPAPPVPMTPIMPPVTPAPPPMPPVPMTPVMPPVPPPAPLPPPLPPSPPPPPIKWTH